MKALSQLKDWLMGAASDLVDPALLFLQILCARVQFTDGEMAFWEL